MNEMRAKLMQLQIAMIKRFLNNGNRNDSLLTESGDIVTHTGQHWEKDDYRNARFIGRHKQVNPNFAIKLIGDTPPVPTKERVVACDGGGGPTGHPKVYINLDKPGNHSCGYCGLRFVKEEGHH